MLKRVDTGPSTFLLTYYVYDDANRLRLVISPQGYASIPPSFSWPADPDLTYKSFVHNWCFRYVYDGAGRLIEQQTPGTGSMQQPNAGVVQMVYNRQNQVVLVQDGNQRPRNEWTFKKYDALRREIMTGTVVINNPRDVIQNVVDGETVLYESPQASSVGTDYSLTNAYPHGIVDANLLTITYFDNYAFRQLSDARLAPSTPKTLWVRGLITGSAVRTVGPSASKWLVTANYYDSRYRLVQKVSTNHLDGVDNSVTAYDFAGKVLTTQLTHNTVSGTAPVVNYILNNRYTYFDGAGRLATVYQSTGGQSEIMLSQSRYNELGQLVDKRLHNPDWQWSNTFLQKVDYRYNIRGWLTNINDRDLSSGTSVEGQVADPDGSIADPDLFGMDICYNDRLHVQTQTLAQYGGNIAEVMWKSRKPSTTAGDPTNVLRDYAYSYDQSGRLKAADYNTYEGGIFGKYSTDFSVSGISYDGNGNITAMMRQGIVNGSNTNPVKGMLDNLTYHYTAATGNQLQGVIDGAPAHAATHDFQGGGQQIYAYDNNGNLQADQRKYISASTTYNLLNQPTSIVITYNRIDYTYSATGTKLQKKTYTFGNLVNTTDYVGPFVYETPASQTGALTPSFAQTDEG